MRYSDTIFLGFDALKLSPNAQVLQPINPVDCTAFKPAYPVSVKRGGIRTFKTSTDKNRKTIRRLRTAAAGFLA